MAGSDQPDDVGSPRARLDRELDDLRAQREEFAASVQRPDSPRDDADEAGALERDSQLQWVDERIAAVEGSIADGSGATSDRAEDGRVAVGRVVTVRFADGRDERLLVGDVNLDAGEARILTPDSPLGAAVLGRKVGATVNYTAPSGPTDVTVLSVEPPPER